MVQKLFDDPEIWQIKVDLPDNPLRSLNSYVIRTERENLVIDTGFNRPECREDLWEGIGELGLDMSKTSLFITHFHSDHCGLVQDFVDKGCKVYMGKIDYDYLNGMLVGDTYPVVGEMYRAEGMPPEMVERQYTENQGRIFAPEKVFPAEMVHDKSVVSVGDVDLHCIHTPGHTPGQIVLYLPEQQILFAADHILFDITPNISVWRDVPRSLADYLDSLQKVRALPIKHCLAGHRTIEGDVYKRIDELTAHHEERLEEIYQAVAEAPGSNGDAIASKIRWSARGKTWDMFPPHQKWFALGETLAHLYYLRDAGRVKRREKDGSASYYPA